MLGTPVVVVFFKRPVDKLDNKVPFNPLTVVLNPVLLTSPVNSPELSAPVVVVVLTNPVLNPPGNNNPPEAAACKSSTPVAPLVIVVVPLVENCPIPPNDVPPTLYCICPFAPPGLFVIEPVVHVTVIVDPDGLTVHPLKLSAKGYVTNALLVPACCTSM
jgi:hypothetical protein